MPNDLIPHKEWMKRTAVVGRRRGKLLKALDASLESYDFRGGSAIHWRIEQDLEAWQKSQGPGDKWKKSRRNQNKAFEDLHQLLHGNRANSQEREAYLILSQHRKDFIRELFKDRKLILSGKLSTAASTGLATNSIYNLSSLGKDSKGGLVHKAGQQAGKAAKELVKNALGELFDDPEMAILISNLLGTTLSGLIKAITPGVGLVYSSSMTAYHGLVTYSKTKQVVGMHGAGIAFNEGDPKQAFQAVQSMAKRELQYSTIRLGSYTAETTTKALGIFADGGTVSTTVAGTAGMIARLLCTLKSLKEDFLEKRAANKALVKPELITNKIFSTNPLLGCYFVACATDSVLLNFMFNEKMKLPSTRGKIEKYAINHLKPTQRAATHCILNHRFALSGGQLPKLSVMGGGETQIAIRSPATYQHITAKAMNTFKGRDGGFHK